MSNALSLSIVVTLLALAALLVAEYRASRLGKWLFKPLASAGFIATALVAGALDSVYGQCILIGLGLSMLGDVLLIGKSRKAFVAGLLAFLLGHVAYVAAFWMLGFDPWAAVMTGIALLVLCLWLGRRYLPRIETGMHRPVIAYAAIISLMLALAVGAVADSAHWIILAGAGLFYVSDLSVARDRLIQAGFINRAWGLPAYYIGQLLLAVSVMVALPP
jgi:uncharacterized membrane protein YhhN